MTPEQQAAYVIAQAACANAEIAAMQTANQITTALNLPATFKPADFLAVSDKYCIGHNAVVGFFTGR